MPVPPKVSPAPRAAGAPTALSPSSCWQCSAETAPDLFCSACDAIKPVAADINLFDVLALPHRLVVDQDLLRQRYYDLSRRLHPDLFQTSPERARAASLVNTATVNRAYRTLRDAVDRGLYWLSLHGERIGADNKRVPPELAALVFEVQEKLEELRHAGDTEADALRQELAAEHADLLARRGDLLRRLQENFAAWDNGTRDEATLLRELKAILSDISYVRTLLRDVARALEP